MTTDMDPAMLARASRFFSARPAFLGHALRLQREQRAWTEAEQAAHLGCSLETLQALSLCLALRPDHPEDGVELSERFGVEEGRLGELL